MSAAGAADSLASANGGGGAAALAMRRSGLMPAAFALASFFAAVLALAPFALVVAVSFGHKIEGAGWEWALSGEQYRRFFVGIDYPATVSTLYLRQLGYTFFYAAVAAAVAVVLAFPFTLALTRLSRRAQTVWLVFLLSSLSLSEIFVVMGWDILLSNRSGLPALLSATGATGWLKRTGWLATLQGIGLANPRNVQLKPSSFATILTMVYLVFPYAAILLYPALSRLDPSLAEAARTMGAGRWRRLRTVIVPLVRVPLAGCALLLFVFLLGSYVTPSVFANPAGQTLPITIADAIRGATLNAPFGAAQSVVLLAAAAGFVALGTRLSRARRAA